MANSMPPLVTVIGKSGAGKTTFLVKLIAELKQRGYKVGTIKHHSHRGFEIDKPGKDSWQHAQAGSDHVVIASPDKLAEYQPLTQERSLDEIAARMDGLDIVLVEGYKRSGKPSIEIIRAEISTEPIAEPGQCLAVVTDTPLDLDAPHYSASDSSAIADLLENLYLKQ